jgi:uroporphyrinogen-III decarboxylase
MENKTNKVQENLEAWCSPPLEFPTKKIEQAYKERARRIADAILLKKPDRVPVVPMWEFFYATYAGYSCEDIMYDPQKAEDSVVKTVSELQPDGFQSPIFHMTGPVYDAYASKDVLWPGHGLPTNQAHQFVEGEYMKADEYDLFLNDPTDFILRTYLPRVSGNLGALATTTPIRNCFAYFMQFGGWAPFGTPDGLQALETLKNLSKASFEYVQWLVATIGKVVMMGYPPWVGYLTEAPFDVIGDTLRGTKGVMLDMFRQPDVLKAACEKLVPIMAELAMAGARAAGNHPIVFVPLHKGTASTRDGKGGLMSLDQFEEFYWPTLRKVMLILIENGYVPNLLVEGDYTSRLEIISDVPPGSCIYHFEHIDIHKAKKILGDKVCIRGCVPIHHMTLGTPDDVRAAAKEQIDVLGEGGGYMIDTTMASEQVKPENMKALIDFTKEYGVYQ